VIDLESTTLIKEVQRGRNATKISSISLVRCEDNSWFLAVASERNTIHVFVVKTGEGGQ
jgi:hypothetical protein